MSVDEIIDGIVKKLENDGSVDYIALTEKVYIIKDITEAILGLFVSLIIIGVPLVVTFEIIYLNIPIVQRGFENLMIRTEGKRINRVLGLVLRDARLAVSKANTVETGVSVNGVYLRMKIKSIIIAVVCVAVVLGLGSTIVGWIVRVAANIMSVL